MELSAASSWLLSVLFPLSLTIQWQAHALDMKSWEKADHFDLPSALDAELFALDVELSEATLSSSVVAVPWNVHTSDVQFWEGGTLPTYCSHWN